MRGRISRVLVAAALVGGLCATTQAVPLGNAWTYQGQLRNGGNLVSGPVDLRFRLFDAAVGGVQVGGTITVLNVPVLNGLFKVDLNFGDVFSGDARWLEVEARVPAGVGLYVALTPRQQLNPTPNALFATDAAELILPYVDSFNTAACVLEITNTGTGHGICATTNSTTGLRFGVYGVVSSTAPGGSSAGVRGQNNGTSGAGIGVWGSQNGSGWGVLGEAPSGRGVYGNSTSGFGVYGASSSGTGVFGTSFSAVGVHGQHTASTGTAAGVLGETNSTTTSANAVHGRVNPTSAGGSSAGVRGENRGTGFAGIGVYGSHDGSGWGVYGFAPSGGFVGRGVYGNSNDGTGVYGRSNTHIGVYGLHDATTGTVAAILGETYSTVGGGALTSAAAVEGIARATAPGAYNVGVRGISRGTSGNGVGVIGYHAGSGFGVYGNTANAAGYAGYFVGRVNVSGALTKGSGAFKIDHPLDPANKYLQHSFVESPDMKNIYDGVVVLDSNGQAVVQLPDYFEALNKDFRYQLTCIGGFANVYIAQEIANNQFVIAGGAAGLKVSWQVTGIRQDAFANANRIEVEVPKAAHEQGYYLHPEALGASSELNVANAIAPQLEAAVAPEPEPEVDWRDNPQGAL